jgi:hypothetical protein
MSLPALSSLIESSRTCSDPCNTSHILPPLILLFEDSPTLRTQLAPQLCQRLSSSSPPPQDYEELISICQEIEENWDLKGRAGFIEGHPRIGEVKGLSKLSEMEQAKRATPLEVLKRLKVGDSIEFQSGYDS